METSYVLIHEIEYWYVRSLETGEPLSQLFKTAQEADNFRMLKLH